MLTFIGIGLNNEKDISIKGLEAVKDADFIFLESYTSKLNVSTKDLEKFYNKSIILADRYLVENKADDILDKAVNNKVAFLVIGDIFSATTHADLFLRAKEKKIETRLIHNASILNAIGSTGLQLYNFGKTTSLVFPEPNFNPETAYDVIKMNLNNNLHTLVLLDIKTDQNKFMTIKEAIEILESIEKKRKKNIITEKTRCVGCSRIGSHNQIILAGTPSELKQHNFGDPLHSLIIPSKLHFIEEEMLNYWTTKETLPSE